MVEIKLRERFSEDPLTILSGLFAVIIGIFFAYVQLGMVLRPEHAMLLINNSPIGPAEWGFIWSDLIITVPLFILGGFFLVLGSYPLGRILTFSAWAINVYGTLFFIIAFQALGKPLLGYELVGGIIGILIGLIFMVYLAGSMFKDK
jgi:hypothetical protein